MCCWFFIWLFALIHGIVNCKIAPIKTEIQHCCFYIKKYIQTKFFHLKRLLDKVLHTDIMENSLHFNNARTYNPIFSILSPRYSTDKTFILYAFYPQN